MKLFTLEDILGIERQTLTQESVSLHDIVERGGNAVADAVASRWLPSQRTVMFAGPGVNGAYALMAASRLAERGFSPKVFLFNIGGNSLNEECRRCRDLLKVRKSAAEVEEVVTKFNIPELGASDLVIDGLFGADLRQPLTGGFMSLVRYINESDATVVSIDVPSGMCGDWNRNVSLRNVVKAHLTLALQFPRLPFFFADYAGRVGQWHVLDIGLSKEAAENRSSSFYLIEDEEVRSILKPRNPFSSKADYGSACIVAGSYGMTGASVLACAGALRAGAGKVTLHGPQCAYPIVQGAVPEAMFTADSDQRVISGVPSTDRFSAVGIGPGIGTADVTVDAVENLLKRSKSPMVLDADALNCIAVRPSLLNFIPMLSVITPHAGEFDRLFGQQPTHEARLLKAVEASRKYNLLILLKGHYTTLVRPDGKIYINSSGTPAMATPGSGDVLTGVLTSFIAQGYKPEVAAIIAAYVHGKAGEIAAAEHGQYGVLASDIAGNIGRAIMRIMNAPAAGGGE